MEYDYYKVYLGTDIDGYKGPYMVNTLDEVEYILNNADMFDKYLVIAHSNSLDMDEVVAQGEIEINKPRKRKR